MNEFTITFTRKEVETIIKSVLAGQDVTFMESMPVFNKLVEAGVPIVIDGKQYVKPEKIDKGE